MWDTVGHDWAVQLLARAIETKHIAHSYLFTGPSSVGKTHLALRMAAALNCAAPSPPCGRCSLCTRITQRAHPDVAVVSPEDGRLRIDAIRALQRTVALSPYEARWRVCVVTDFHAATTEAANAFLKTLEEPPRRVVLVLTASDPSLLPATIVSRCQVLSLRAVPIAMLQKALVEQWNVEPPKARLVAHLSAGRVGWAIRALNDGALLIRRGQDLEDLQRILASGPAERILAAEKLCTRADLADLLQRWQGWWRDIVLLCSGCDELLGNLDVVPSLRQQAAQMDLAAAQKAARDVEGTLTALDQNANARLALEVLLLSWPKAAAQTQP